MSKGQEEPQCAACLRRGVPMTTINPGGGFPPNPVCSDAGNCTQYSRANKIGRWADGKAVA
jgi:hypothetical protein